MPNWTCYFTSTIKYHTLVLSQGTQLTGLTAPLANLVLWDQHINMIVRSTDQCRCQKCMKYFGPSRRDQNNYRRIFFSTSELQRRSSAIRQPPTTNNNHQQPPTTTTLSCCFTQGLLVLVIVCDFLDQNTGYLDVRIHVQYVDLYQNI